MSRRKPAGPRTPRSNHAKPDSKRFFTIVAVTTLIVLLLLFLVYRSAAG